MFQFEVFQFGLKEENQRFLDFCSEEGLSPEDALALEMFMLKECFERFLWI